MRFVNVDFGNWHKHIKSAMENCKEKLVLLIHFFNGIEWSQPVNIVKVSIYDIKNAVLMNTFKCEGRKGIERFKLNVSRVCGMYPRYEWINK